MATATVNTGNFAVKVSGDLKPEVQSKIIDAGVLYELQRGGLSAGYLALGGVENDKGKVQLPKDFVRDSVEFSDDNREVMHEAIAAWAPKFFDGEFDIVIEKYEGGGDAPMKRATLLVDSFLGSPEEVAYRTILQLPEGTRDELIAKANEMRLGISPEPKKKSS